MCAQTQKKYTVHTSGSIFVEPIFQRQCIYVFVHSCWCGWFVSKMWAPLSNLEPLDYLPSTTVTNLCGLAECQRHCANQGNIIKGVDLNENVVRHQTKWPILIFENSPEYRNRNGILYYLGIVRKLANAMTPRMMVSQQNINYECPILKTSFCVG